MPTFHDQVPTFRKFGRLLSRIFTWHRIRRFLLVSVTVVTIYAVYCTEENWRWKRAWDGYLKQLAAQGVLVTLADLDKYKPVPIPDDQNFWGAPYLKQLTPWSAVPTNA